MFNIILQGDREVPVHLSELGYALRWKSQSISETGLGSFILGVGTRLMSTRFDPISKDLSSTCGAKSDVINSVVLKPHPFAGRLCYQCW